MKTKTVILLLMVALSLAIVGLALASDGVAIARWVLGSGGMTTTAGNTSLSGMLGQPIAGAVSDGHIVLEQGFWHGNRDAHHIYLPLVQK